MLALPKFMLLVNRQVKAKKRLAEANQRQMADSRREKKLPQ